MICCHFTDNFHLKPYSSMQQYQKLAHMCSRHAPYIQHSSNSRHLTIVIIPGVCLAQFSLNNVHKRGLKHHNFISFLTIVMFFLHYFCSKSNKPDNLQSFHHSTAISRNDIVVTLLSYEDLLMHIQQVITYFLLGIRQLLRTIHIIIK